MENTKKFAIIGLGFVSKRHIQSIKEIGGELVYGCDIDPTKRDVLPDGVIFTTDYRNIKDVDYAIICSPNDTHYPMSLYFLARGIKVLTEKPPVISSEYLKDGFKEQNDNINVVLQLHYHPEVIKLKEKLNGKPANGKLVIKVKRDQPYWDSWKGQKERSGGIVFNIGIHYIDFLMQLNGKDYEIVEHFYSDKLATGKLKIGDGTFDYHIEIIQNSEEQTRSLEIDGEKVELSKQDNLAFEDLHTFVYKDLLEEKCLKLSDLKDLICLVEKISQ